MSLRFPGEFDLLQNGGDLLNPPSLLCNRLIVFNQSYINWFMSMLTAICTGFYGLHCKMLKKIRGFWYFVPNRNTENRVQLLWFLIKDLTCNVYVTQIIVSKSLAV